MPSANVTVPVKVLAVLTPGLAGAVRTVSRRAFVILDGTLLPTDRGTPAEGWGRPPPTPRTTPVDTSAMGMNIQVLTAPLGRLLGDSPAPSGSTTT